jgi:Fur family peroxide stress response transcriptional regulator
MTPVEKKIPRINERLAISGFRLTPQRQRVYNVLVRERDHPTAERVFIRAKKDMPDISMATVYNCLGALVKCGLAKQVNVERGASRFCPNMHDHLHFQCEACGGIFDIDLDKTRPAIPLPRGFRATQFEISIRGFCPDCSARKKA